MVKAKHTYKMPTRHKVEVLIAFLIGLGPWIYGLYEVNMGNPMPEWIFSVGSILAVIGVGLGSVQLIGGKKVRKNSTLFAESNSDDILSVWMVKPGLAWKGRLDLGLNKVNLNEVDNIRTDNLAGQDVVFLISNQKDNSSSIVIPKRLATTKELSSYLDEFFSKKDIKLDAESVLKLKDFIKN
jgi:hypothetical protein